MCRINARCRGGLRPCMPVRRLDVTRLLYQKGYARIGFIADASNPPGKHRTAVGKAEGRQIHRRYPSCFAQPVPRRLTCQPPCRERPGSDQLGSRRILGRGPPRVLAGPGRRRDAGPQDLAVDSYHRLTEGEASCASCLVGSGRDAAPPGGAVEGKIVAAVPSGGYAQLRQFQPRPQWAFIWERSGKMPGHVGRIQE